MEFVLRTMEGLKELHTSGRCSYFSPLLDNFLQTSENADFISWIFPAVPQPARQAS